MTVVDVLTVAYCPIMVAVCHKDGSHKEYSNIDDYRDYLHNTVEGIFIHSDQICVRVEV